MRLTFVSYPAEVDSFFEDVCARLRWSDGHRYFRVKSAEGLLAHAVSEALIRDISCIDVVGHGEAGYLRLGEVPLFHRRRAHFALGALPRRAQRRGLADTVFRFLGCQVATDDGWELHPKDSLRWLSEQLDGRTVFAPTCGVEVGDFDENGFTAQAAAGLMSSR
jgi:hypothetical protein